MLSAAVLTGSGCSTTGSTSETSDPSATAAVAGRRPLPADAIVPAAGADLCTLLGAEFLNRYLPGYTLDGGPSDPYSRPEYRRLSIGPGGTGPELDAGGCMPSADNGLARLGVTLTRELPGPGTTKSPEQRCALIATAKHDHDAAETPSLGDAFPFEDMPALGPGGFRELEVRNGKVMMVRVQGCHGSDWVSVSLVPGPRTDAAKAPDDAVAALQEIYRRLGDA